METHVTVPEPLVSIVIPVYNSLTYLRETLDSLLDQGLTEDELEVVIVNDGSDDGSERVVDEYAERYRNFRVIHQEQSGGPATPCNVGAYAARGRYFFLLGSDDLMTPRALHDLAEVAEREGSDVVLGKLGSLGGRGTPKSVYKKTVLDADPVKHKIFNTLSAVKLFRTELLRQTGALHPKHLPVGSDQPFTAALYLAAKKFSICADREYVLIRRRDDGSNVTSSYRSPSAYADLAGAVLGVITSNTEPGPLRDGAVRRTFRREIPQIVRVDLLDAPEEVQRDVVLRTKEMLLPVYNERTALHADPLTRTKLDLIIDEDLDALRRVLEWELTLEGPAVDHGPEGFFFALPEDLRATLGGRLHAPAVKGTATLTHISYLDGKIQVDFMARASDCRPVADSVTLRLRHRKSGRARDYSAQVRHAGTEGAGGAVGVLLDPSVLTSAVWDAYIVQHFGNDEIVNRFGGSKRSSIEAQPIYLFSEEDGLPYGKAYFTEGYGNLSIDIGFVHTKNELRSVDLRRVLATESGQELAIAVIRAGGSVGFTVKSGEGASASFAPAMHHDLDQGLYAVELPRPDAQSTADRRALVVQVGADVHEFELPEASARAKPPADAASHSSGATLRKAGNRALGNIARRVRSACRSRSSRS